MTKGRPRKLAINPAAIECPRPGCAAVVGHIHVLGGHQIAKCGARTRRVAGSQFMERCNQHMYIVVDGGDSFAVAVGPELVVFVRAFAAAHGSAPAPSDILRHLGLDEAA